VHRGVDQILRRQCIGMPVHLATTCAPHLGR
jgi:hypothetical protein